MTRLTPLALASLVLAGCAAAPPPAPPLADPHAVFAEAFANPLPRVTVETSGGPVGDSWLVFSTADRVELKNGERFSQMPPGAALAFFAEVAPGHTPFVPTENAVCLAWRDLAGGADRGAYLLFELGSGRYFYRRWGEIPG